MSGDYARLTERLSGSIAEIRRYAPETMHGFSAMAGSAMADGVLDKTTKELMALAIGIAGHCKGCIGFHVKTLVKLGVGRDAFCEMLGVAVYMGGGPSLMYAAEALQAFDEFSEATE